MNINKSITFSLLLFFSSPLVSSEYESLAEKIFKRQKEEHKAHIKNDDMDLKQLFLHQIHQLATIPYIEGVQEHITNVTSDFEEFVQKLENHNATHHKLENDEAFIKILQKQAQALRTGIIALKSVAPQVELRFRTAADCLSRVVAREFPSHTLNWLEELPLREKNKKEKEEHEAGIAYTKNAILKSRTVSCAYHGWRSALVCPFAAYFTYIAARNKSYFAGSLAAALTAWSGYDGYAYYRLKNLPAPSEAEVLKIWAHNIEPKLP